MAKLKAPSGFRDFLPDACRKRAELIRRIRETYEGFGYEPIETPAMENLDVFLGKGGGENEKLMFRVMKRAASLWRALEKGPDGEGHWDENKLADCGLRFDLTVPLARFFAEHRGELPGLFKRYHIGPVWRAERAQRGRFREFIQCDVDVLGSDSPMVEADVIFATATALAKLGFDGLTVRLNARPLLTALVKQAGVPDELAGGAITSIDKLGKVERDELKKEMLERGISEAAADALLTFEADTQSMNAAERLDEVAKRTGETGAPYVANLRRIMTLTPELPSGELVFDPFLARGLDYYTGSIFEIAAEGVPFSLAGGGRYDKLIGQLSGADTPACGFSIGFERVLTLMDERGMFDTVPRAADVLVVAQSDDAEIEHAVVDLGRRLRDAGVRADVFPGQAKPNKLFELAERKGIPFIALYGSKELSANEVTFRDLAKRENISVPTDQAAAKLKALLA